MRIRTILKAAAVPSIIAASLLGTSLAASASTLPGLLCNLPIKFPQVWADCRTKGPALVVEMTCSHRKA